MKGIKKAVAFAMAMALTLGAFTGCSGSKKEPTNASADGKKTFTFGDTTFNAEMKRQLLIHTKHIVDGPAFVMVLVRHYLNSMTIWSLSHGWQKAMRI